MLRQKTQLWGRFLAILLLAILPVFFLITTMSSADGYDSIKDVCPIGQHWDYEIGACVLDDCPEGQHWDATANDGAGACVPTEEPTPAPTPAPTPTTGTGGGGGTGDDGGGTGGGGGGGTGGGDGGGDCPAGEHWGGVSCISDDPDPHACNAGYHWEDPDGCVANPTPTPRPDPCFITMSVSPVDWHTLYVTWSECTDDDFGSYKLYRSTEDDFEPSAETYIDRGSLESDVNKTDYQDEGLEADTTYYYVLRTSHGGTTTDSRLDGRTPERDTPLVTFEGYARSCAGGVAVDGVHDFSITGTARREDNTPAANAEFKLSFEGNKGHDYEDGRAKKKAKFVTTDASGRQILVEELTVISNGEGKFGVHVLSSDIVSSDIKIKVKHRNSRGVLKYSGNKNCDFGSAECLRRFPNQNDPEEEEDTGWLFDYPRLTQPDATTPAKIYMKFMIDPSRGDVDGNWKVVNGHRLLIKVDEVEVKDDATEGASGNDDYATIVDPNNPQAVTRTVTTSGDGAAQVTVKAGTYIEDAETVSVGAVILSQFDG